MSTDHRKTVFVVHGRNRQLQDAMFDFLKSLGLNPRDFDEFIPSTRKGTPYIGEVLKKAFKEAQAVIVLMTPDDEGRVQERYSMVNDPLYEKDLTPQARLNVIFEAGMALGRSEKRAIIVEVGFLRPFSDLLGRHTVRLDNTIEKREILRNHLKTAECDLAEVSQDWKTAGNFDITPSLKEPVMLREPLENLSVQRWLSGRRKKSRYFVDGDIPHKKDLVYAITEYGKYVYHRMNQNLDEIIADAKAKFRLEIEKHNQLIADFCGSRKQGTAYSWQGAIQSFYRYNGINLMPSNSSYKRVRKEVRIPTQKEIQKICHVADIEHRSWILANSYMGLGVEKIALLTVKDFQKEKWKDKKPIYPVHIGKSVNASFEYTIFIGQDAKNLLDKYFSKFASEEERPWNFHPVSLRYAFKRYAYQAKVIDAPNGVNKDGVPKGLGSLTPVGLRKRLENILGASKMSLGCHLHLLGIKRTGISDTNLPSYDELYEAYLGAEPKLRVY